MDYLMNCSANELWDIRDPLTFFNDSRWSKRPGSIVLSPLKAIADPSLHTEFARQAINREQIFLSPLMCQMKSKIEFIASKIH